MMSVMEFICLHVLFLILLDLLKKSSKHLVSSWRASKSIWLPSKLILRFSN